MGSLPRARPAPVISPHFVEDRRVHGNVERPAVSMEGHTRPLLRGVADAVALSGPHLGGFISTCSNFMVRLGFSRSNDNDDEILTAFFQVFWTAPLDRE